MRSISSGCRADAIAGGQGQRLPVRGLFPSCQSLTQLWKQRRRSPRGGTPLGPAGSGLRGCSAGVLTHGWRIGRGLCGASDGRPTRGAHPGRAVRLRTVTSDQKDSPMSGVRSPGSEARRTVTSDEPSPPPLKCQSVAPSPRPGRGGRDLVAQRGLPAATKTTKTNTRL